MIITLNQEDIEQALTDYVKSFIGRPFTGCDISIKAGRGENGYSADVELLFDAPATGSNSIPSAPINREVTPKTVQPSECEEQTEEPAKVQPKITTLADKVSNAEEGKKTAKNLFAQED